MSAWSDRVDTVVEQWLDRLGDELEELRVKEGMSDNEMAEMLTDSLDLSEYWRDWAGNTL